MGKNRPKPTAPIDFPPASTTEVEKLFAGVSYLGELFDLIPDCAFFVKDLQGKYLAVNQSLVDRCGLKTKLDLVGKKVGQIFSAGLAQRFASQDAEVIRTGRAIVNRLEVHWYAKRREGWCVTTKLPLKDSSGKMIGLIGVSRDIRVPGDAETIPMALASMLEYLETHYSDNISPTTLARIAKLPSIRFSRLIKRIFGITPRQLITQTRLAAASRMLLENDSSIAEIALACGFYDHSAFSRVFKSASGQSPQQFRSESVNRK